MRMTPSLVDTAHALLAKADEQGTLFDMPLVPVKKVVHRRDGTHVQTFHVHPEAPAAPASAAPAPAAAPEPAPAVEVPAENPERYRDVTAEHAHTLRALGIEDPDVRVQQPQFGIPELRSKYKVGHSNYHDTVEDAAREYKQRVEDENRMHAEAAAHAVVENAVVAKLKRGETPTASEWIVTLHAEDSYKAKRRIRDGYIDRGFIREFLVKHFPHKGFKRTGAIAKPLGAAHDQVQSQYGSVDDVVNLNRLAQVLRDEPAADPGDADPPAPPQRQASPDTVADATARLTDALAASVANADARRSWAVAAAADDRVGNAGDPEYRFHAKRAIEHVFGHRNPTKRTDDVLALTRLYDALPDEDKAKYPLRYAFDSRWEGKPHDDVLKARVALSVMREHADRIARALLADLPSVYERPRAPTLPEALAQPGGVIPARPKMLPSGTWGARVNFAVKPGMTVRVTTKDGKTWDAVVDQVMDEDETGMTVTATRVAKKKPMRKATHARLADLGETLIAKALNPNARATAPKALKAPAPELPKPEKPSNEYPHATVVSEATHPPQRSGAPKPTGPGTHAFVRVHETHPKHPRQEYHVPRESLKHHLDELHGRVSGRPNHTNEHVNAVIRGDAEHLGRGNDGMAFKSGDKVVKVGGVTPLHPHVTGAYRTPAEAAQRLQRDGDTSERLRAAGVPMMPKTEVHHHEGRAFMVREHMDIPEKFSKDELDEIQDGINGLHRHGHALKDQIQVGRGRDGRLYHYDTGTIDVNRRYNGDDGTGVQDDDDIDRDLDRLEALYRRNGHEFEARGGPALMRTLKRHAHDALSVGQNHGDKYDPSNPLAGEPMDFDPAAHTQHLNDLHARVVADVKKHHTGPERERLLAEADAHLKKHATLLAKGRKMRADLDAREAARAKG